MSEHRKRQPRSWVSCRVPSGWRTQRTGPVFGRGPYRGVSWLRPFRRRCWMIRRPPGESMRWRNPWTRRRYRFLGW